MLEKNKPRLYANLFRSQNRIFLASGRKSANRRFSDVPPGKMLASGSVYLSSHLRYFSLVRGAGRRLRRGAGRGGIILRGASEVPRSGTERAEENSRCDAMRRMAAAMSRSEGQAEHGRHTLRYNIQKQVSFRGSALARPTEANAIHPSTPAPPLHHLSLPHGRPRMLHLRVKDAARMPYPPWERKGASGAGSFT